MLAELRRRKDGVRERLGKVLDGRYRLEAVVGSGGSGAVYRARLLVPASTPGSSRAIPTTVAIKILHPHLVSNATLREVFMKEAAIAARVGHPGAVQVFDASISSDGTAYLVAELLEGRSLHDGLVGWGDLLLDEVVRVTRGVLEVLAAAHESGVVHCDVKPENVFVLKSGAVKLLDFGVARITGEARRTGIAGTLAFMAPEQARGEWADVDARSDVWSVGATFFTLITGTHLFPGGTPSLPVDVPEPVADVIRKALAPAPADRFPNARQMLDALIEAAHESGIPRSTRTMPDSANEENEENEPAPSSFTLRVPPYPVSLDAIAPHPVASAVVSKAQGNRRRTVASKVVLGALVVAAAGLLGAALAIAVPPGNVGIVGRVLDSATRARVPTPRPLSSTATTSAEVH
jgi:serine/threonine-protein kinase